jgi:hypothetical protein
VNPRPSFSVGSRMRSRGLVEYPGYEFNLNHQHLSAGCLTAQGELKKFAK